jgi:hypothetical protein
MHLCPGLAHFGAARDKNTCQEHYSEYDASHWFPFLISMRPKAIPRKTRPTMTR